MVRSFRQLVCSHLGLLAALALLGGAAVTLGGCHTVEGAGRDVQGVGRGVERGAEEVRFYD